MKKLRPDLPLARYFFKDKDIRADGRPRPNVFKPKKGNALSAVDIEDMSHPAACEHGHQYADNPATDRIQKGYASLAYSVYQMLDLSRIYDNKPSRHVSIKFPDVDESRREMAKARAGEVSGAMHCEVKETRL